MIDWGTGTYELTAERLEPAAEVAVAALAPQPGERLADVGCGTGNAALRIARAGATAIGVDPAERLLEVGRSRAAAEKLSAEFVTGEGAALPFADDELDGLISVFGVIFGDIAAVVPELVRVVRTGGRIVLTTWTMDGATPRVAMAMGELIGRPPGPATWSDPDVVRDRFAGHDVAVATASIAFDGPSVEAYVAEHADHHPLWLASAPALRERGLSERANQLAVDIYTEANEDPAAFRTTSTYSVITVTVR